MDRTLNVWIGSDRPDLPESHIYAELPCLGVGLTFFHAPDANPEALARIREGGADCVEILFRNRLDFAASAALRRELRRRPCDVIYATVNKPLAAVLRATIGFPRVKVVGYRGTIGHLSRLDPASWLTYFHPGLDHVVTVSDAVRRYFTDKLRFPEDKVTRIYKGHDAAWYRAVETYDGAEYTTLTYVLEDGDQYVEIAFWLDGESAEQEAQAIINTLTFVTR